MTSKKVANVFTAFEPLYNYLKPCGLFLYSFNGDICYGNFEVKFCDKIWSLASIFLVTISMIVFMNCQTTYWSSSLILFNAYMICALVGLIVAIFLIMYQMKYARKIIKILYLLHEFDEKVIKLKTHVKKSFSNNFFKRLKNTNFSSTSKLNKKRTKFLSYHWWFFKLWHQFHQLLRLFLLNFDFLNFS
jgi:hypothetical protein